MKLVVREHTNLIAEPVINKISVTINSIDSYGKIPSSIGLMKGDLIVFRGNGDPVRFPSGNANGKTLVTDNTSPTGWILGDGGGGGGGTVSLHNDTQAPISAGTVVYGIPSSDVNESVLLMRKANATTTGQLYVLKDSCAINGDVECYALPGTIALVLCDTLEINQGDALVVSDNGICTVIPNGIPTVGIALSHKNAGTIGLVKCKLVENKTTSGKNKSGVSTMYGTVYRAASGGADNDPNLILADKGKQPYGVQANIQSNTETELLLHHRYGEEAMVRADTTEIQVGDWLVPSATTPGMVRAGNGYGIGYALEAKADGATGLIRCLLKPGMYGISPRCWYLPSGVTEDQVIAAYQFVNRNSEAEALVNVNNGTEYALTKSGTTVVWNTETGFTIPATASAGLRNTNIHAMYDNVYSAAFGFRDASIASSNLSIGGVNLTYWRNLAVRGIGSGNSTYYSNVPTINRYIGQSPNKKCAQAVNAGVLAGNWATTASETLMYIDGISQALVNGDGNMASNSIWGTAGVISQPTTGTLGSFKVTAVVLFATALTAEQHLELALNIRALGGLE